MAAVSGGDIREDLSDDIDTTKTMVVANSPVDRGIGNALRRLASAYNQLAKSNKNRVKSLDERAGSLDKREGSLDKWEGSLDKREGYLDKLEVSLNKREATVVKLESGEVKKTDDSGNVSGLNQKLEKAKVAVGNADDYTTLAEKLTNVPKRSTEFVKNYKENKAIAKDIVMKVKSYMETATSAGALTIAKAAVVEGLKELLGLEGDDGGAAGEVAGAGAAGEVAGAGAAGEGGGAAGEE
ncbi:hypothetical protein ACQ4PT_052078 [Festuca glaucescens]